jgi:hypothetical protein
MHDRYTEPGRAQLGNTIEPPREQRTIETFIHRARGMNDMAEMCIHRLQVCLERLALGQTPAEVANISAKNSQEPPELAQLDNLLAQLEGRLQVLGDQVGRFEQF